MKQFQFLFNYFVVVCVSRDMTILVNGGLSPVHLPTALNSKFRRTNSCSAWEVKVCIRDDTF